MPLAVVVPLKRELDSGVDSLERRFHDVGPIRLHLELVQGEARGPSPLKGHLREEAAALPLGLGRHANSAGLGLDLCRVLLGVIILQEVCKADSADLRDYLRERGKKQTRGSVEGSVS